MLGGFGGGPWLDGRIRMATAAIGSFVAGSTNSPGSNASWTFTLRKKTGSTTTTIATCTTTTATPCTSASTATVAAGDLIWVQITPSSNFGSSDSPDAPGAIRWSASLTQ